MSLTHATQIGDFTGSAYSVNAYNTTATSLGGASIVDLARARIMSRNGWTAQQADVALFGSMALGTGSNLVQPLFASELVQGMRIDINRALGNGADDNANGVVDEPSEVPLGETLSFPLAKGGYVTIALDLNNDGVLPGADTAFFSDWRAAASFWPSTSM